MVVLPSDPSRRSSCPAEFATFFADNKAPVFRALLAQHMDRAAAEDATAEGFARALVNWDSVAQHPNPRAWVIRTARNAYLSWRRSWDDRGCRLTHLSYRLTRRSSKPSKRCPSANAKCWSCTRWLALPLRRSPQMLQVPIGTVSSWLSRARSTLRNTLGETLRQEDPNA
jgi:RNA polymerase sigma-70 factor (ECF subfamily)